MDEELIKNILERPESVWIKVPAFNYSEALHYKTDESIKLYAHHYRETSFLINLVKELAKEVQACWIDSGKIGYTGPSDNDLSDGDFQNKYSKPF